MTGTEEVKSAGIINDSPAVRITAPPVAADVAASPPPPAAAVGVPTLAVVDATWDRGTLLVTVEGKTHDAARSLAARNLAYAARLNHGLQYAGLETVGATLAHVDADGNIVAYRTMYRLTPG